MDASFQPRTNTTMADYGHYAGDSQLDIRVSFLFYSTVWVMMFPSLYLNILVLQMLKREKLCFSLELKVYTIGNIIASIWGLVHHGILNFAFPASVKIGSWYCHVGSVIMVLGMWRNAIHSFSLSVYRYVFIVHRDKIVNEKQKQQLKLVIFAAEWTFIIIFMAKNVIFNKDELALFWNTVCNGEILTQQIQENPANLTQFFESLSERSFYRKTKDNALITVFGNVEGTSAYPLQAFCIIADVLILAMCTNILEGILYRRVAKHMKA